MPDFAISSHGLGTRTIDSRDLSEGLVKELACSLADPAGPLRSALREELRGELARHLRLLHLHCTDEDYKWHMPDVECERTQCKVADELFRSAMQAKNMDEQKTEEAVRDDGQHSGSQPLPPFVSAEGSVVNVNTNNTDPGQSCSHALRMHTHHFVHRRDFGVPTEARKLERSETRLLTWRRRLLEQYREFCRAVTRSSNHFNVFVCLIIVLNGGLVAMETQLSLQGEADSFNFDAAENAFLVIFIVELLMRYGADGNESFKSGWFILDLILVSTGVLTKWIIIPVLQAADSPTSGLSFLEDASIIRTIRLLRLARTLRLLESMKDFCRLTTGLLGSFRTVLSGAALMIILLFLFGPMAVELITSSEELLADPDAAEVVQQSFPNLWISMMTLIQFTSGDSMSSVYGPLVKVQPYLAVYFGVVWLTMTLSLMNIIGALLVLNAIEDAKVDAEMEQIDMRRRLKKLEPQLKSIFDSMDCNRDGALDISELCSKLHVIKAHNLPDGLRDIIKPEKLVDLFEFLDVDNSGTVDEDEFVRGVGHLALSSVPVEIAQALNLLKLVMRSLVTSKKKHHKRDRRA